MNHLRIKFVSALALSFFLMAGCGSGGGSISGTGSGSGTGAQPAATPTLATTPGLNGAELVTLATTSTGASIYYTTDGSTPTTSSPVYEAPFLVDSNETVKAMATGATYSNSPVASQSFTPNIASGTLVWSEDFTNTSGANAQPDPSVWTYDTGAGGWGNNELETYCAWNSSSAPCSTANPNAYVDTNGYLHIVAEQPSTGVYTSARLKTQGLFSFQYGRVELRAEIPEEQGLWPAIWLLGNSITTKNWPACGEMDMMEHVNTALTPDWIKGSVHGTGFTGDNLGTQFNFPAGETAAGWHTYGMIWNKGSISYYVDDPSTPYATFTPSSLSSLSGAAWPFDDGPAFLILNMAVGGSWPGAPDSSTQFPAQMLVQYVHIYTN
ncbi:MAG: chitobiase/beta-hexosaminidase C-terminal domain-containing protein [Acidobacteriaceae bacterium]